MERAGSTREPLQAGDILEDGTDGCGHCWRWLLWWHSWIWALLEVSLVVALMDFRHNWR